MAASFPNTHVVRLPNGVDVERFASGDGRAFRARHSIPQEARVIACVARIDPQKNQMLLLDILASLPADVHLLLVGHVTNEAYQARLLTRVGRENLAARVTLVEGVDGLAQELVDAYHAADVFCLPSRHEPFGIAILEAWASVRPVVAARVGGVPSFVDDGVNGLLFPDNDHQAAREALRQLLEDASLATRLAREGREKACREFSWSAITKRLIGVYDAAIARVGPAKRGSRNG